MPPRIAQILPVSYVILTVSLEKPPYAEADSGTLGTSDCPEELVFLTCF